VGRIKHKLILGFIIMLPLLAFVQKKKNSREDYIERYKKIAIEEMKRSAIPASITLAQGMLESNNGNSTLAINANNHFGIKCHKNWDGRKIYHDDDADNECFRSYETPEESYLDHSNFLMGYKRYAFLFEYKSDDYKNWAKGLKKAGYATSPTYPQDLIRIIEENKLYLFDQGNIVIAEKKRKAIEKTYASEEFSIDIKRRKVYELNRVRYIIVGKDDNLEKINKDLDLFSWQIKKYNELSDTSQIKAGQLLYIQPKRFKAEFGSAFHFVKEGETMYAISQMYGVRLKSLYNKNRIELGTQPQVGEKLWLRSKKPKTISKE
jgi:LysM repeat protein